jgi:hypothetical protein
VRTYKIVKTFPKIFVMHDVTFHDSNCPKSQLTMEKMPPQKKKKKKEDKTHFDISKNLW